MQQTLMALGDYRFAMNTAAYETLRRQQSYRWKPQQRLLQRPALQFTGLGEDIITLEGVVYPDLGAGFYQLANMREQANKGQPLLLVDGLGYVWGLWVIQRLTEQQTVLSPDGQPRKQTFQLQLAHYGQANEIPNS